MISTKIAKKVVPLKVKCKWLVASRVTLLDPTPEYDGVVIVNVYIQGAGDKK